MCIVLEDLQGASHLADLILALKALNPDIIFTLGHALHHTDGVEQRSGDRFDAKDCHKGQDNANDHGSDHHLIGNGGSRG